MPALVVVDWERDLAVFENKWTRLGGPPQECVAWREDRGMDPHFFFEGTLREEAASAFLATLLEQDPGFRGAFVRRIGGGDGAGATRPKVQVEPHLGGGKWPDVLMELPGQIVLIENKVRLHAVRPGQLARYHAAAALRWPRHRVVSVFLAPDPRWGYAEARQVRRDIRRQARDDSAVVLTWSQVRWLLHFASGPDAEFRRTGIAAIMKAIADHPTRSSPVQVPSVP